MFMSGKLLKIGVDEIFLFSFMKVSSETDAVVWLIEFLFQMSQLDKWYK